MDLLALVSSMPTPASNLDDPVEASPAIEALSAMAQTRSLQLLSIMRLEPERYTFPFPSSDVPISTPSGQQVFPAGAIVEVQTMSIANCHSHASSPSSTISMEENSNPRQPNSTSNHPNSNPVESSSKDPVTSSTKAQPNSNASKVSSNPLTIGSSSVWNHFTKVIPPNGSKATKCTCKYCHKEFGCASEHGTSSLKRHLDRCLLCPSSEKNKKQKLLDFKVDTSDGKSTITSILAWKFDYELCRKALARMIIMDELPFIFVERDGFRDFCKALQPRFNTLTRNIVAQDCLQLYLGEKKKLQDLFKRTAQRVSLITDMWASIQNLGYLCLTAHYIDRNWKLQKKIINFCVVPSPPTGEAISNALELCLI
ncbi:zinc finger BED domain-containing protein DAYSLEEPER-like [Telopea speciosissima]|uniref:zinc finger BED domain-containing protein DAYSLEEPER-like n=1 Tax=Telopea speciosissima TaxID=54955 RepID=UPI001CC3480E|nr:zinc finger BED domain-containing protein DAYSLEEPER-like [Telopea speciosissima]